jgi:hypothetical protein
MSESKAPWPPQVGDHVQIVATGSSAIVIESHQAQQFLVAIYSHTLRTVTAAPHRLFTLRQLGPESAPPVEITSIPPASRRHARRQPAAH